MHPAQAAAHQAAQEGLLEGVLLASYQRKANDFLLAGVAHANGNHQRLFDLVWV